MDSKILVRIQKAISSFKNGFPVLIDGELLFCRETTDPKLFIGIDSSQVRTSHAKSYYNYHFRDKQPVNSDVSSLDGITFTEASKAHCAANKLCVEASLLPCSISIAFNKNIIDIFDPIKVSSDDIIAFERGKYDNLQYKYHCKVPSEASQDVYLYGFSSTFSTEEHYAIVVGNPLIKIMQDSNMSILTRVHSSCYTGDLMSSLRCDCKYQLHNAIKLMQGSPNGGIILYLMQEGRGIGLMNKIKTYDLQQNQNLDTVDSNQYLGFDSDYRSFLPAKIMLDFFNIKNISLITNNPNKLLDIKSLGINVTDVITADSPINEFNAGYLRTKHERLKHGSI